MRFVVAAAVAGLALAGCGGDDEKSSSTTPATTTQTQAAAPKGPDGLESVVRRCSVGKLRAAEPDIVPAVFRPAKTRVMSAQRTDNNGYTATLLYDKSPNQVYGLLRQQAPNSGYAIIDGESEGFEAELAVQNSSSRTELRISALRDCPQYSQARVTSQPPQG
jgi:hypothetical protein